ncbi:hypothetical protein PG984_014243 [Apiospora sp. TS-2023a]
MAEYSQVFVVIDALDEYQTETGSRGHFLSMLSGLQAATHMNLLATAREVPDIRDHFKNERSPHIEVRASDDDIPRRDSLKDLIIVQISKAVQGMFLLAQLHLESLKDKDTVKAIREALERMSDLSSSAESTYRYAYSDTMTRITGQLASHARRAKQVLGWIVHAERPLNKLELQHALGVELGQPRMDPENLPEIGHMVAVCAGLVTIDKESEIIRLVHYTVQEYFVSTKSQWFPEFQETMAMTCISYLSLVPFAAGPCDSDLTKRFRDYRYPFYDYAARHWGHHARGAQTREYVLQFLQTYNKVEVADQARDPGQSWIRSPISMTRHARRGHLEEVISAIAYDIHKSEQPDLKTNGLHLAAVFGLESAVREMLRLYDVNARGEGLTTALELAARNNHPGTVRILVEKGADLISQKMALYEASKRGYLEVVRCLTENDSPSKSNPGIMANALSRAASREICELLVERGANVNFAHTRMDIDFSGTRQSPYESLVEGMTPLHCAIERHGIKQAELLIENGANVNAADSFGRTPLYFARQNKELQLEVETREKLIQFLVEHGADDYKRHGWTELDKLREMRILASERRKHIEK